MDRDRRTGEVYFFRKAIAPCLYSNLHVDQTRGAMKLKSVAHPPLESVETVFEMRFRILSTALEALHPPNQTCDEWLMS